jgi:glutamyl-tRNA synthetase
LSIKTWSVTINCMNIRTRIAPSPTGFPHIGTIYQVLIDYAVAKKNGGQFILRLEDTDRSRLVEGAEEVIYSALSWFGLNPDESPKRGGPVGPYRQSERLSVYKTYIDQLVAGGHAFYCFCTKERLEDMRKRQEAEHKAPMYDGHCLSISPEEAGKRVSAGETHVVRMKIPQERILSFDDILSGHIEFKSSVVDQQVILKSDGFPTYHFAVVVDDHLMGITHIFRGKEWISSTPKHILLYEYFGWEMPVHGHLPLILNEDGKGKLSKRHGHASVDYYKQQGYLPEAVLNYLSNIIWHHPEGKEIYSLSEFIELFDIRTVTSQAPRFNLQKLQWVNKEYLKALSTAEYYRQLCEFDSSIAELPAELVQKILPYIQERMTVLSDFYSLAGFFFARPQVWEQPKDTQLCEQIHDSLQGVSDWRHDSLERAVRALAETIQKKPKDVFMMLRIAVTGKTVGPPLLESLEVVGKEETLSRLIS